MKTQNTDSDKGQKTAANTWWRDKNESLIDYFKDDKNRDPSVDPLPVNNYFQTVMLDMVIRTHLCSNVTNGK